MSSDRMAAATIEIPASLKVSDVSRILGVDDDTVLSLVRSGKLAAFNVSQSSRPRWRFRPEVVEQFMERQTVAPRAPTSRRRKRSSLGYTKFVYG